MTDDIWEIAFTPRKPVHVAFTNSEFEQEYIYEDQGDEGIYVTDPRRKRIMFIPWSSISYLAWDKPSAKEKQGGKKK